MGDQAGRRQSGPRCIALVGPFQSGKTTLLEAVLERTGAIARMGATESGSTVSDSSAESRQFRMSVEAGFATTSFMGDDYTFVDCPGSVDFLHDMRAVIPAVDAAVVVCEADEKKVPALGLILRELEDRGIPRILFINKIDKASRRLRETLEVLRPASRVPLLLRQIPIWSNGIVSGFVDLALERAFVYREHAASEVIPLDGADLDREKEARFSMLETLADHDDELMETLLSDLEPPRDRVFDDLGRELAAGLVVPVLFGSALQTHGVLRLLKTLRHDVPPVAAAAGRLGVAPGETVAQVMKTVHTAHGGKISVARLVSGSLAEGAVLTGAAGVAERTSGLFRLFGPGVEKMREAKAGDTVALGKLDHMATGEAVTTGRTPLAPLVVIEAPQPVLSLALSARDRKDDVRLGLALGKLVDEDPSLAVTHDAGTGEIILAGQGEMHLRVAMAKLSNRYGVAVNQSRPAIGYRETIKKAATGVRGRHRKQSGGHGQFGDVVIDVKPVPRGTGFQFDDRITGGVVPKQYIPAVREGVADALRKGPLGFPVVDLAVTLTDGSFHTVDSSDMAFQQAGRIAIQEALAACHPVLLEPVLRIAVTVPSEATARVNAIVSARRGQILGFDARERWPGWDVVSALMPEAEIGDLIVEIRSATAGVGSFTAQFDHLAELTGRDAERIVQTRAA
ncbi:elongation factor G [Phreatobacter cathodiphilus]|uniref:Elongation factor G n=1 Tax=Phreatobacter cathodiphilus TaxID=1868589 RepID=A0A2S0N9P5_9HYPH|nr:elongation factor G [Phreatobacter cathodiphilus]AVO44826.1 elongation factor G [Phreatobacter cathodiphilus]